ncbi:hypothetical protein Btru_043201 [Bulinus truncatus]|nr:hypothetical protein Btru_043201 [Bulinus truncatus]
MKPALTVTLFTVLIRISLNSIVLYLGKHQCTRVVCYYIKQQTFDIKPSDIKPNPCTHIIISRYSINRKFELSTEITYWKEDPIKVFTKLKEKSDVKLLIAIQNDEFFEGFVAMYSSESSRKKFFKYLIQLLRLKKIDGVKIDNQLHPGGSKEQFTKFIGDMACEFLKETKSTGKPKLILSVGLPSDVSFLEEYYDIPSLLDAADMVDIGSYYFNIPTSTTNVKHHSPLKTDNSSDPQSIDYLYRYVLKQGVFVVFLEKINLGLSTKAVSYIVNNKVHPKYYTYLKTEGYKEHCRHTNIARVTTNFNAEKGTKLIYRRRRAYYILVILDNEQNLKDKVEYILRESLGGVVVDALNYDDYTGASCGGGTPYPLINAIAKACRNE